MAKSKKKPITPNIAFIERIEIAIKDNTRRRMLRRAPKPASNSISSTDILNQQYLLQRTLAQRIQPAPQQQSQTVNVYLADVAKLQRQETLKRIDEDAAAAIIRTERGGINQERLDAVLAYLSEQRRDVKKQPAPLVSFDYGFVKEAAVEYKEEQRAKSVLALERLNKAEGPRSVAFETTPLLPPRVLASDPTRRRALTPQERRALSVEAGQRASELSRMTARELADKYPDLTSEIMKESQAAQKSKYRKRRSEIEADITAGRLTAQDGASLLRDFSVGIGYDVKPRFRTGVESSAAATAAATSQIGLTDVQSRDFPKTAAIMKRSQTSTKQLETAIIGNIKPASIAESVPAAEGGQGVQIQESKIAGSKGGSVRQKAAKLVEPGQGTMLQFLVSKQSAGEDLQRDIGASSPTEPFPPSRPSTAGSQSRPTTGESFTRKGQQVTAGAVLPQIGGGAAAGR